MKTTRRKDIRIANTHIYSRKEEVANAITHGIGAVLSIAALVLLIVFSSLKGTAWHVVSFTIYGTTMLLLYINSTLVHSLGRAKRRIYSNSSIILPFIYLLRELTHRFCSLLFVEHLVELVRNHLGNCHFRCFVQSFFR